MKNPLSKIQEVSKDKRKIIFWLIMIVLTLTLSGFYIKYVQQKVSAFSVEKTKEELQIQSLEEIIDKVREIEIPKIEMPKIDQDALQGLQRMMEEASKKTPEETLIEDNHNEPIE